MTQSVQTLTAELQLVCRDYFPRWRHAHRWRLMRGARASWVDTEGHRQYTSEHGHCDRTTRRIHVSIPRDTPLERQVVLIHEICHAVTTCGHGTAFCRRLRQAAARAQALGDAALESALTQEADAYAAPGPQAAQYVYTLAEDWVAVDGFTGTLDALVEALADETGSTAQEIRTRFPRLPAIYKRAKAWRTQQDALAARFGAGA